MEGLSKKLEATQKEVADLERAIASGQQRLMFLRGKLDGYRDVAEAVKEADAVAPAEEAKVVPITTANQ